MEVPIFPVTPKEAEEYGIENRAESNRNCPFARRLASLRQEKGLTQQKLADLLNCSKSTISLYETGDTVPDAKNIVRLCDIFGVSCDYLLCDDAAEEQGNAFGRPKQETQTAQTLNQVKVIRTRPERRLLRALRLILIAILGYCCFVYRPNPSQNALFRGSVQSQAGRSPQMQGKARR